MKPYPKLLTKSKYIHGLNCKKFIWLEFNAPEELPGITKATQQRFDEGYQIEQLAKTKFKDALTASDDNFGKALEKSKSLLKERKPLFEASFIANNCYARADVLMPVGKNEWDIIEIKSGTTAKEHHFQDVSFQKYIYESAGLKINKCFIMRLNNQYVRKGELNVDELFLLSDITEGLQSKKEVENNIKEIMEVIALKKCPAHEPGGYYCRDPYEVHHTDEFYKKHPKFDIMALYRAKDIALELFHKGIIEIKDIPEEQLEKKHHKIQHKTHKTGEHHIHHEELDKFISELKYPLYFMDFETYSPAIPIYNGMKPYQQMPFQFSVQVVSKINAKPKNISFIAHGPDDPREEFLDNLKEALGNNGSIVAYNAPFEKGIISKLAEFLQKHQKWANSTLPRVVDLLVPFRNFSYYHPSQKGSISLKKVLPAVTGETYADLEISEGETASRIYYEMIHSNSNPNNPKTMSPSDKANILKDLEDYCKRDTEGMIWIVEKLKELIGK